MPGQATAAEAARPYVPRLLLEWLAESPERTSRTVDGTVAFVDISGFTRLSERLARQGRVGAEVLSETIGTCFERLLDVAYDNGAGLLKFGGDALLLLFTGPGHESNACRAAFEMQARLRATGVVECFGTRVVLRMSIGVHSGAFDVFLVGASHRELIIAGPAASETVRLEAAAGAGEILVSPATAAALPPGVLGGCKGPGMLLRRAPAGRPPGRSDLAEQPDVDVRDCLPVALRQHLVTGAVECEHKAVTVAFVHFDGTDALLADAGAQAMAAELHRLVQDVQRAADRYGVCFLGSDVDQDGGKLLLASGAPVSRGRDEELLLLALREVLADDRVLDLRVGVHAGHVFAGEIGPSYRRTYTVMGDAVNLAARVMAHAAAGELLATEDVLARTAVAFDTRPLEPFRVKGKSAPVRAAAVGQVRDRTGATATTCPPLVGRTAELLVLRTGLASATSGRGRLVALVGEAGIGKSRLVDELVALAADMRVVRVGCQPYDALTPWSALGSLLRGALALPGDVTAEEVGRVLLKLLAERAPELLAWAPLLAAPLGAALAPTPEIDRLDAEARRRRMQDTCAQLLALLLRTPTVIVVEDAQWMDDPTGELIRHLSHDLADRPWLVCVTRRDVPSGFWPVPGPDIEVLRPAPLAGVALVELAEALSEARPLAPHELAALTERSGGNPLFLMELVATAATSCGTSVLPDSLEAVVVARLDCLPAADRSLLRRLSVLGSSFEHALACDVLAGSLPAANDPAWQRLDEFVFKDGGRLRFRQALLRDGAYETLPFRLRRELHAAVGEALEQTLEQADEAAHTAGLLSLHFFHARCYDKAWRYAQVAAEQARAEYANVEAADLYGRALAAAEQQGRPAAERAAVLESLGDVRCRLGEFPAAAAAYRAAHRLVPQDPVTEARLLLKQGTTRQRTGRFRAAAKWLARAQRAVADVDGQEAARARAQVAVAFASLAKDEGRWSRVVTWATRCIDEAEQAQDKDALAHAYSLIDTALLVLGRIEQVGYGDRALALYLELDDLWGQGVVLNNLGAKAYWRGQWDDAVALYERSQAAWLQIGDSVNAAISMANIGEIRCDQGRLDEAEALLTRAQRIWTAAGDRASMAFAASNLGRLAARDGRFEQAATLLAAAAADFTASGARGELLEVDVRVAESLVLQGRYAEARPRIARAALQDAGTTPRAAGQHAPALRRLAGWCHLGTGDLQGARVALETSLTAGRERGADYEIALTLQALHALALHDGCDPGTAAQESARLLAGLGVVRVSEPPRVPLPRVPPLAAAPRLSPA